MKPIHARHTAQLSFVLIMIFASLPAFAKLNAAPGEDGAPPDPQTQAEVDAINDALEPPEEDESWEAWLAELEAAHEAHYGPIQSQSDASPQLDCSVLDDSTEEACDGGSSFVQLSDPYDLVLSEVIECPYDGNYAECLLAGETIEFCKQRVLNCRAGELSTASATVDFDARQCLEEPFCLCSRASGTITFFGTSFFDGEEVCLNITSYSYDGPWDKQARRELMKS